jgi:hypothetical protein
LFVWLLSFFGLPLPKWSLLLRKISSKVFLVGRKLINPINAECLLVGNFTEFVESEYDLSSQGETWPGKARIKSRR